MTIQPLSVDKLYHACDLSQVDLESGTDSTALGQDRALQAIHFSIAMPHNGYNLFVSGSAGIGKRQLIAQIIEQDAKNRPPPSDWCYVNNFDQPHTPDTLELPIGAGATLSRDMLQLIETVLTRIPAAFHSDEYRNRVQEIQDQFRQEEENSFQVLGERARSFNISLMRTPNGYSLGPMREGKIITPEDFNKLPDEEKTQIKHFIDQLNAELNTLVRQVPKLQQQSMDRLKQLEQEVTHEVIDPEIQHLKEQYIAYPAAVNFLEAVYQDMIENVDDFFSPEKNETKIPLHKLARSTTFHRYQVNVLASARKSHSAPVVHEDIPSYQNLIGRIEYTAHFGTLSTDFTLIQPGALHKANGGFLILDARKLLSFPFAWEGLKRALRNQEIKIDSLEKMYGMVSTRSLEPEAIPLAVKVVLVGDRHLYYLLKAYDPEFPTLFKVYADFAEELDRHPDNIAEYAGLITSLQKEEKLLPIGRDAIARMIEQSSRQVDDSLKLSLNRGHLVDLLREANFQACQASHHQVESDDVDKAVSTQRYRNSQYAELMQQQIERGTIMIDTEGAVIGQANALSVFQLGDQRYGHPSRITATARLGNGHVMDIEREIKLGGAIHSKGVMILGAYIANHYARDRPLSLNASLVFEQSYGPVDGDSASALELCTLISAISKVPVRQHFAATGSVNQHGQIQAIGGVNEKIEGFYELCKSRGLTGNQGVIIPSANVPHLVLNQNVVTACRNGDFYIYAVETIDEMLSLLCAGQVGKADTDQLYPPNSTNGKVQQQLIEWCEIARKQSVPDSNQQH
ncbi:MAG: Lon protease family protein [Pontibacterium sp.]